MSRCGPLVLGFLGLTLGQVGLVPAQGRAASTPSVAGPALASSAAPSVAGPALASSAAPSVAMTSPSASEASPPKVVRSGTPPSARQQRALERLLGEAEIYEKLARDFERASSLTIRHHYEERRRRVLSALDREINVEKRAFGQAREQAIARLEHFVERYSGANADPKATPDAMFRLAALYEERARAELDQNLADGLSAAIQLYRRIIAEQPAYEERAAVHYYLAHALTDAGRLEEGQQAFRALVCQNHYQVVDEPASAARIAVVPLVQDHDAKYWDEWTEQHPVPLDQAAPRRRRGRTSALERAEELTFRDPYAECQPIPQSVASGDEPRYLAEAWWQLGNYHFDQIDPAGGPYSLNRAVSAYEHGLSYKKPPIYGVTLYKLAWAFFKQERYRAATEGFVRLLRHADEEEVKTGESGADFRAEATTYIASALTYRDFDGPDARDPHIPRSDVLDLETDPLVIEQKMGIALERVKNPALVDQDRKWSVEIYKALAQEYIDMSQYHNAIAALEMALARYGLDRDAPLMQHKIGELYEQLARLSPEGSMARSEATKKTLEARGALAVYVGQSAWTEANRDDPVALERAEQLVRGGLMRAAADHTNLARSHYERARELNEPRERRGLLEQAKGEYRLADQGWTAYLEQDPTAADAYDTRFWLADARVWAVLIGLEMHENPSLDEVRAARDAARAVRDSNEDDKYLQPAAYYLVNLAEKVLEGQYYRFRVTGGAEGLEAYDSVRFEGEGEERRVRVVPLPEPVQDAVKAREQYVASVPYERDPFKTDYSTGFRPPISTSCTGSSRKRVAAFVRSSRKTVGRTSGGTRPGKSCSA
jgi:tetratricopeptide (TPR) repeat protein